MNNIYLQPLVCGLTGSIAVGKSTVAKFFEKHGLPQIDADIVARDVVTPGSIGLQQIVEAFGSDYLNANGTLFREKLANLVFNDQSKLDIINKIMRPLIDAEVENRIADLKNAGHHIIIYNAALIIEQGNADKFRPLVVVSAPLDVQLTRLMKRNNLSEHDARARIGKQLSSEEKSLYADFVIETTGTLDELENKTLAIVSAIKAVASRTNQDGQGKACA